MKKLLLFITVLFISIISFGQSFTTDTIYFYTHGSRGQIYKVVTYGSDSIDINGIIYKAYWGPNGNTGIRPMPSNKLIHYPAIQVYGGTDQPKNSAPVWWDVKDSTFRAYTNSIVIIVPGDTIDGCEENYVYNTPGQDAIVYVDSIIKVCGCFTVINNGLGSVLTIMSVDSLLFSGDSTIVLSYGQSVTICPDTTHYNIDPGTCISSIGMIGVNGISVTPSVLNTSGTFVITNTSRDSTDIVGLGTNIDVQEPITNHHTIRVTESDSVIGNEGVLSFTDSTVFVLIKSNSSLDRVRLYGGAGISLNIVGSTNADKYIEFVAVDQSDTNEKDSIFVDYTDNIGVRTDEWIANDTIKIDTAVVHKDSLVWQHNEARSVTFLKNNADYVGIGTNIPSQQLEITKNFALPTTTTSTVGVIMKGVVPFIHDYGTDNVWVGKRVGNFITTGTGFNVGIGADVLTTNSTGFSNVAIGNNIFNNDVNNTGYNNIGIGNTMFANNTSGSNNIGIGGSELLYSNTTGENNIAIGHSVMSSNKTGGSNIGIGGGALSSNVGNIGSIAIGSYTLGGADNRETGRYTFNIAIGNYALYGGMNSADNTGRSNTVVGDSSMAANSSGYGNTALGKSALVNNTTGYHNTAVGDSAFLTGATYNNSTALGYGAQPTKSNQVVIGNSSVTETILRGVVKASGLTAAASEDTILGYKKSTGELLIIPTSSLVTSGTSRYVAYSSGTTRVEVLASGAGITATFSAPTQLDFTIPSGVNIISAKINVTGVSTLTIDMGTTDMGNTTLYDRWMPIVQVWRDDTGAEQTGVTTTMITTTHDQFRVNGLTNSAGMHIRLSF